MKTKYFFPVLLIAGALLLGGCWKQNTPMGDYEPPPTKTKEEAKVSPPETENKMEKAMDIVHEMKPYGMNEMRALYPDLKQTAIVSATDPKNILEKSDEPWFYSEKDDVTVIVCTDLDTPLHIFSGKNISQNEIDTIKAEVMGIMDEGENMMNEGEENVMMEGENTMMERKEEEIDEGVGTSRGASEEVDKEDMMDEKSSTIAQYIDYDSQTFAEQTGKKLLFFHADWCPTCRAWEKKITENLSDLPLNTYIAKADYDTETELKKEYGITVQSAVVFIENGQVIKTELAPSLETVQNFFES